MIRKEIADTVLTVGPSPDMHGGIAQVLTSYFDEVFASPKFVPDTVNGGKCLRMAASVTGALRMAWRLATDRKIRIVHFHTAHRVSFPRTAIYARIARLMRRKVIIHMHGSEFKTYYAANSGWAHRVLSRADRIVALSQSWHRYFTEDLGLTNVVTVDNIISAPRPDPSLRRHADGVVHALFLGQLGPRKGIFDLLQAVADNASSLRGRFMLHVGGNGEVARFTDSVKSLGIEDMVQFHGWVDGQDKERLLSECCIFLLPSYAEGLPISILEAMAYSNAVIATPVGGVSEIVDSSTGVLVDPGDIKALGAAIVRLAHDPELTARLGANGITRTAPHLSDAVARKLETLYSELL